MSNFISRVPLTTIILLGLIDGYFVRSRVRSIAAKMTATPLA